jgi:hypothetical protein
MCYRKVVDNFIILLVLKFDSHKSDRLGVMLFTNSVTESVQIRYRFQKIHCLLKLMLESVLVDYKKVVDAFLILLVLKFHNHRSDSLRVMNFTNWLLCSVHCQKWYVYNFITFPESLGSICLDVWILSCEFLKSQVWICPNLDRAVVFAQFDFAKCWIMLWWKYQNCSSLFKLSIKS